MEYDITHWLFRFSYCTFLHFGKEALQTQHSFIPSITLVEVTKVSSYTQGDTWPTLFSFDTKNVAMAAWLSLTRTSTGPHVFGLRER